MDKAEKDASQIRKDHGAHFSAATERAIGAALRQRDEEIAKWRMRSDEVSKALLILKQNLREVVGERDQAREEIARLKERFNGSNLDWVAVMLRDGATIKAVQAECDQARAERDAAVGAVHELITAGRDAYDNGYPEMERAVCEARAVLARLPQAALLAQAQRDVIAAARDVDKAWSPDSAVALRKAFMRLDAMEGGGG